MITKFEDLKGQILKSVTSNMRDEVVFTLSNNDKYMLSHYQSCCETVEIESISGDLSDLVGEVLLAREATSSEGLVPTDYEGADSFTWTFYRIGTIHGTVTIRWFGTSNGYYSEEVNFEMINPPKDATQQ